MRLFAKFFIFDKQKLQSWQFFCYKNNWQIALDNSTLNYYTQQAAVKRLFCLSLKLVCTSTREMTVTRPHSTINPSLADSRSLSLPLLTVGLSRSLSFFISHAVSSLSPLSCVALENICCPRRLSNENVSNNID
jgi:hypothetical protein